MDRNSQALLDMLQSAKLALTYIEGITESHFYNTVQLQDAVIRRLLVIGEAAGRISTASQDALSDVAWPQIRGMRNRLVHEYDGIDLVIVWQTTQVVLPKLVESLESYFHTDDQPDKNEG